MKIAVLSRNPALYSTQSILRAGRKRGHYMIVLDHMRCDLLIEKGHPSLFYENERISGVKAIIPRIGASATEFGVAVIRHFESKGVFSSLSSEALLRARNKFHAFQILASNGVTIPKTIMSNNPYSSSELLRRLPGPPYIIKLLNSTHGIGVIKSDTTINALSIIDTFFKTKQRALLQEFIAEAEGADLRAFIVDGKIVASMKRQAQNGEFRSNLHRGATARQIMLTQEEQDMALRSAELLGLKVAGVDILRSNRGPVVLEVNASPGLEGIETTTGMDIGGKIVEYVERNYKPN